MTHPINIHCYSFTELIDINKMKIPNKINNCILDIRQPEIEIVNFLNVIVDINFEVELHHTTRRPTNSISLLILTE